MVTIDELITENKSLRARVEDLEKELLKPAVQCENCDDYYAPRVMRMTNDDVIVCPGCYKECCRETEVESDD
jgi:hypothetical protein